MLVLCLKSPLCFKMRATKLIKERNSPVPHKNQCFISLPVPHIPFSTRKGKLFDIQNMFEKQCIKTKSAGFLTREFPRAFILPVVTIAIVPSPGYHHFIFTCGKCSYLPHFTDGKTEAQRCQVICPSLHS